MGSGRMSRDDLRRAGHALTLGIVEHPHGRRTSSGVCACGCWSGESVASPHAGGLQQVQRQHVAHIEAEEGGPLPPLSNRQREMLTTAVRGRVVGGTDTQYAALRASGLVSEVGPGRWQLTPRGVRVAQLVVLAADEADERARRGELARQGLIAPEGAP